MNCCYPETLYWSVDAAGALTKWLLPLPSCIARGGLIPRFLCWCIVEPASTCRLVPCSASMLVWRVLPSLLLVPVSAYCSAPWCMWPCIIIVLERYCWLKPCSISLWTMDILKLSCCHALCIIGLRLFMILVRPCRLVSYSIPLWLWAWSTSRRTSGLLVMLIVILVGWCRWIQLTTWQSICAAVGPDSPKTRSNRRCTQQWDQFVPVIECTTNKPTAHMIESALNTFHLLRINCSSGIIRSLKRIFNLGNNREKRWYLNMWIF